MAQDTAHTAKHTERADRGTGAMWPRTLQRQHNTLSVDTGEQEASGQGHRTRNTTRPAYIPLTGSQVAQNTAQATKHAARALLWSTTWELSCPLAPLVSGKFQIPN